MIRRWITRALPLAAVLALAACSAPRVAYERADWLAALRVGQYVDLDATQERQFDADFDALWRWHRAEELPRYRNDLRDLAAAVEQPLSFEVLASWASRAEAHAQRTLRQATPASCTLVNSFDAQQRASLLARLDERLAKDRARFLVPPLDQRQAVARKRLQRNLERWIGALETPQLHQLAAFADTRPARWEQWLARRERWRLRLGAALEQPSAEERCAALQPLLLYPGRDEGVASAAEPNTREWFEFLAALSHTLTPTQREHLRTKLLALADEFDQLHAS